MDARSSDPVTAVVCANNRTPDRDGVVRLASAPPERVVSDSGGAVAVAFGAVVAVVLLVVVLVPFGVRGHGHGRMARATN